MLYLFDLDGTLIQSFLVERPCNVCRRTGYVPTLVGDKQCPKCSGRTYTLENVGYDEVVWLPDRLTRLAELAGDGHDLAIVTNQTGVEHGYQTSDQVAEKMALVVANARTVLHGDVPYFACTRVRCRKPAPFLLQTAMTALGYRPDETVMVGDMDTDRQAANAAGVRYIDAADFFRR